MREAGVRLWWAVVVFAAAACATGAADPLTYEIRELGSGVAVDVNNLGQVVGGSGGTTSIAFVWDPTYGWRSLETVGGQRTWAKAINDLGQIVGYCGDRAAVWQDGSLRLLEPSDLRGAEDINGSGQVVGLAVPGAYFNAFIWHAGGVRYLGSLGGNYSAAYGINDLGQVVGNSVTTGGQNHAFLWENGVMRDLGTPVGYNVTGATDINNLGWISGYASIATTGSDRAVLWSEGVIRNLGLLPGYDASVANGLNDVGQVIGASWLKRPDNNYPRAFLWQDGTMHDLGALPGHTFSEAFGINNHGEVVGVSYGPNREAHAVMWTVTWTPVLVTGSLTINSGATYTNSPTVVLGVSATSAGGTVSSMRFSSDAETWNEWEPYVTSMNWTLTPGDGEKTVYVQFKDDVGNQSPTYSDTIILDATDPTVAITGPTVDATYSTYVSTLDIAGSASDTVSVDSVAWSSDRGGGGACGGTTSWSATGVALMPGDNLITVTAIDPAGNIATDTLLVNFQLKSIGAAKRLPAGTRVTIQDAVVTAGPEVAAGSVFVESSDRSSGIRLITDETLRVGQRIEFTGTLGRVDGEFLVSAAVVSAGPDGGPLSPVAVTTRTIGNDPTETLDYIGINTTGLLVKLAGKVTARVTPLRVLYLDDGRKYQDGLSPYWTGIRVHIPEGVVLPAAGARVVITGISRVEKHILTDWAEINGDWYPPGTTVYVPSVWMRGPDDMRVLP